jgi:hypothetical protein
VQRAQHGVAHQDNLADAFSEAGNGPEEEDEKE